MTDKPQRDRPPDCTDEVLLYLDELRESGDTNMYGAGPYLVEEFGCDRATSHLWLAYWMETFSARHDVREVPHA